MVEPLRELALFAGAGGGILGGHLLGWRTVCAVELAPYPVAVLCARQNEGVLPPFPIWGDIRTFDGRAWRGRVEVVSGGFPCQDISAAGKGAGITGEKSGLWREMARVIREVGPRFVFVENSPLLTRRGLGVVLGDLAEMGFDAEWGVLGAADVGAPHQRDRIWILAYALPDGRACQFVDDRSGAMGDEESGRRSARCPSPVSAPGGGESPIESSPSAGADLLHANSQRFGPCEVEAFPDEASFDSRATESLGVCWSVEPDVGRVADGVAARVDRLRAIGNGQVPQCAAEAFCRLLARLRQPPV